MGGLKGNRGIKGAVGRASRFRNEGWGPAAALAALWLLAFWPVARAGYAGIGDGLNHFYRLVGFEHLLRQGSWVPRWGADLGFGYGYPLFNYYPSFTYYLGAFFHT